MLQVSIAGCEACLYEPTSKQGESNSDLCIMALPLTRHDPVLYHANRSHLLAESAFYKI